MKKLKLLKVILLEMIMDNAITVRIYFNLVSSWTFQDNSVDLTLTIMNCKKTFLKLTFYVINIIMYINYISYILHSILSLRRYYSITLNWYSVNQLSGKVTKCITRAPYIAQSFIKMFIHVYYQYSSCCLSSFLY